LFLVGIYELQSFSAALRLRLKSDLVSGRALPRVTKNF
jgi:hypothetical protein